MAKCEKSLIKKCRYDKRVAYVARNSVQLAGIHLHHESLYARDALVNKCLADNLLSCG